jgi:hypothetical protein
VETHGTVDGSFSLEPFLKAQAAFRRALNEVFVYASTAGVNAADAATLPSSLEPSLNDEDRLIGQQVEELADLGDPWLDRQSEAAFTRRVTRSYAAFQRVMCREVSAEPRPQC